VTQPGARTVAILTVIAVAVGALILMLAITEEPYHIDELRQVRSYTWPYADIVDASFAQEQPPLDAVLNATVQRALGLGDVQQRLLPVLFGIGSLAVLGMLLVRSGLGIGAPVAVALMAIAPGLIAVTAYARPYALPLLLSLLFLEETDRWLQTGSKLAAAVVVVTALMLPLSRTVEPPVLLAATAAYVVVLRLRRAELARRRWVLPVAAAVAGLVVVEIPVFLRLSAELSDYTDSGGVAWSGVSRFASDLPAALWRQFGAFGIVIVLTALLWPAARSRIATLWWLVPLAAVPVGFALLFFLRASEAQPYFDRYVYSWWPPLVVLAGVLAHVAIEGRARRVVSIFALAALIGLGFLSVAKLRTQLTEQELPDWNAVSAELMANAPDGAVVLYDSVRDFGLYRTPFAGWPRYTGPDLRALLSLHIAADPALVPDDASILVALLGEDPDVAGWTKARVDPFFAVYVKQDPPRGHLGAADTLAQFGRAVPPEDGAAMLLAAASLYDWVGLTERAVESTCAAINIDWPRVELIRDFAVQVGLPVSSCENA